MEDKLKYIFENVNDWLKFAEQKNAAIIVFNTAMTIGILNVLKDVPQNCHDYLFFLKLNLLTNLFSIIIALLSFIPVLKRRDSHHEKINKNDNLIFYMDIANYSLDNYYEKFISKYGEPTLKDNINFNKNLVSQIVNNSKITKRKYFYFKWAGRVTLSGFLIVLITFLLIKFL